MFNSNVCKYCKVILISLGLHLTISANPILTPGVWTDISPSECTWASPANMVLRLAIDPSDHNVLYACVGNADPSSPYPTGLYRTTDGGSSWKNLHHFGFPGCVH
jgi:hypothetical protein